MTVSYLYYILNTYKIHITEFSIINVVCTILNTIWKNLIYKSLIKKNKIKI